MFLTYKNIYPKGKVTKQKFINYLIHASKTNIILISKNLLIYSYFFILPSVNNSTKLKKLFINTSKYLIKPSSQFNNKLIPNKINKFA